MFAAFTQSLALVLTPMGLLSILGGVLCGIFVGVMPGLSSVMGMSIMLPVALSLNGNLGVLMMLGIFCGAIYGGSITAIMINTPGTANSAATCLDGYPMAHKHHQPGRALSISTTASTFGGLFSAVMLLWTSPILSSFALKFSAQESFALALFGISVVASVSSENVLKGVMGALIGLLLATVGVDVTTGAYRFTFDTVYLTGGISNIPVLIGLFAFSQGLINVQESFGTTRAKVNTKLERVLPSKSDLVTIFPTLIRSSLIGTLIGAIPGHRGDIASWVGYNEAKRWSKHPEQFGDGAPRRHRCARIRQQRHLRRRTDPFAVPGHPRRRLHRHYAGLSDDAGHHPRPSADDRAARQGVYDHCRPVLRQRVHGPVRLCRYPYLYQDILRPQHRPHAADLRFLLCGHLRREPHCGRHLSHDPVRYPGLLPY